MITCQICEFENRDDEEYCNQCGAKLEEDPLSVEPVPVRDALQEEQAPAAEEYQIGEPVMEAADPADVPADVPEEEPEETAPAQAEPAEAKAPGEEEAAAHEMPAACTGCNRAFAGSEKFCPDCGQPRQAAPVEEVAGPRLVLIKNDEEITSYAISDPFTIGRTDDNAISFPDDGYTSSKHAAVVKKGDDYHIEDLGSTNGTLIKIDSYKLSPGDVIYIGQNMLKFEI